jgi:flagellin
MVALQTMKGINMNLNKTQADISTGKNVASAKDNAAVWAISKVMESDVEGFKGISDSLSVGNATLTVARNASESVTKLLTEMKGKIVAAQAENVDRSKLQTDITQLTKQIESVVGAAQFNGLNLVDGSQTSINVLSSLDRSATGVASSNIEVTAQDLSTSAGTALTGTSLGTLTGLTAGQVVTGTPATLTGFFIQGTTAGVGNAAPASNAAGANPATLTALIEGDAIELTVGATTGRYVVKEGDTQENLAEGLRDALIQGGLSGSDFTLSASTGTLSITNNTNQATNVSVAATRGEGGLAALGTIDVTSDPAAALASIEGLLQTSINAAASFGSAQKRVDIQSEFVGKLTDSLKTGIGAMVDTDMEEASARLQALQVQQQLATQALSIANQQPQGLLSLFR